MTEGGPPPRVLVVDSDTGLASAVSGFLRRQGYRAEHVGSAKAALTYGRFDLVVLERVLPDLEGLETCRRLRRLSDAGIIMVATDSTSEDRVAGLRAGADDYIAKPFRVDELHAR